MQQQQILKGNTSSAVKPRKITQPHPKHVPTTLTLNFIKRDHPVLPNFGKEYSQLHEQKHK